MKTDFLSCTAFIFAATLAGWMRIPTAMSTQKVLVPSNVECIVPTVPAAAQYKGLKYDTGRETRLRISNGGAGQSGLVGALASTYIDWSREHNGVSEDYLIDWVTGDTTESINYLATGDADIAITYNAAAENRAMKLAVATRRGYGFRDHFYLVGPGANPANLTLTDSVYDIFNKIVTTGNTANGPLPTRFLSRYDKSATNIKESLLFAEIGQVPWAYAYSKWYHQYPQYPIPALTAASLLQEYTLSDRGTFLTLQSQNKTVADNLVLYKRGEDNDPADPLLNPAAILLGGQVCEKNLKLAQDFVTWMIDPNGGQAVVKGFQKPGTSGYLYTTAPDCKKQPEHCAGW